MEGQPPACPAKGRAVEDAALPFFILMFSTLYRLFISALSVFLAGSALLHAGESSRFQRPDYSGLLMRADGLQLRRERFAPETRVAIFFYTASWCAACKEVAQPLREAYPKIRGQHPESEFVTFCVDDSVSERAAYLRDVAYPWLAMSPAALKKKEWQGLLPGIYPHFQAFAIREDCLEAISEPGEITEVLEGVSAYLESTARTGMKQIWADCGGDALQSHRMLIFGKGSSPTKGRAISRKQAVKVLGKQDVVLPKATVLRCRVRYFTDGVILGSKEFVRGFAGTWQLERGRKHPPKVSQMQGSDWGDLAVIRGLRRQVFG